MNAVAMDTVNAMNRLAVSCELAEASVVGGAVTNVGKKPSDSG